MRVKVKDVIKIMESYFPLNLAEKWDNPGLQIGSYHNQVDRVMVSLDLDAEILEKALQEKVQLIITHHPFFFNPIKRIDFNSSQGRLIRKLIQEDISVYTAHTNLDAAELSLSQVVAEKLGLVDIRPLDRYKRGEELYKVVVYVPAAHADLVRQAVNDAGAGHIGNYSDCSFRTPGTGTFRPGEGADPFIGSTGLLEEVDEYRLETIVYKRDLKNVLAAMEKAHPYEEIAYDIYQLENEAGVFSMGRRGTLRSPLKFEEFAAVVKEVLQLNHVRAAGDMKKVIKSAAVVSGAGAGFIGAVIAQGIDVFITGDVKYHEAKDAVDRGLNIIDAGHQGTEQLVSSHLCRLLAEESQKRQFEVTFIPARSSDLFNSF